MWELPKQLKVGCFAQPEVVSVATIGVGEPPLVRSAGADQELSDQVPAEGRRENILIGSPKKSFFIESMSAYWNSGPATEPVPSSKRPTKGAAAGEATGPVPLVFTVTVPAGHRAGDELLVAGPEGRQTRVKVPEGLTAGDAFTAMCYPGPPVVPLTAEELEPWLRQARNFKLNYDFVLKGSAAVNPLDLIGLMSRMKEESDDKWTIQALTDKIFLSQMLDNMDVPQMPTYRGSHDLAKLNRDIESFVEERVRSRNTSGVVLKPTHLSNGSGLLVLNAVGAGQGESTVRFLQEHMQKCMKERANEKESQAFQTLRPGFMLQPKYVSCVGFAMPLELRVVALWGKARVGIWWWGTNAQQANMVPQRSAWLCRRQRQICELSDDDDWEVAHEHVGRNRGFDVALELFLRHMPAMAATTEHIATMVGAPFLRADFFVGSPEWGVRLNEVAYGSGIEYRRHPPGADRNAPLIDDAPAMAQILQEGMAQCGSVVSAASLLGKVGVRGRSYVDMSVEVLPQSARPPLPPLALRAGCDAACAGRGVPEEQCVTPRGCRDGDGVGGDVAEEAVTRAAHGGSLGGPGPAWGGFIEAPPAFSESEVPRSRRRYRPRSRAADDDWLHWWGPWWLEKIAGPMHMCQHPRRRKRHTTSACRGGGSRHNSRERSVYEENESVYL